MIYGVYVYQHIKYGYYGRMADSCRGAAKSSSEKYTWQPALHVVGICGNKADRSLAAPDDVQSCSKHTDDTS